MTYHLCQTPSRDNVSGVDKAVKVAGRLLDGLAHVIVAVEVEDVGDQVERILIVLDFGVQAREVEPICEVLLVDLAEVLVTSGGDELAEVIAR